MIAMFHSHQAPSQHSVPEQTSMPANRPICDLKSLRQRWLSTLWAQISMRIHNWQDFFPSTRSLPRRFILLTSFSFKQTLSTLPQIMLWGLAQTISYQHGIILNLTPCDKSHQAFLYWGETNFNLSASVCWSAPANKSNFKKMSKC